MINRRILCLSCLPIASLRAAARDAVVGRSVVKLVPPDGLVDATAASQQSPLRERVMVPSTHRLLAFYLPSGDAGRLREGITPALKRYAQVQVAREFEDRHAGPTDFAMLRRVYVEQQRDLLARNLPEAQRNLDDAAAVLREKLVDKSFALKIDEALPLGVFLDTPDSVGSSAATRVTAIRQGQQTSEIMLGAFCILRLRDRIVFTNVYSAQQSGDDIRWLERTAQRWAAALTNANGPAR